MTQLKKLIDRIINRVNINLREPAFDVGPYLRHLIPYNKFVKFYAFYGLSAHHPLLFRFSQSSLAGSFLPFLTLFPPVCYYPNAGSGPQPNQEPAV
jgi:hypothetical protein